MPHRDRLFLEKFLNVWREVEQRFIPLDLLLRESKGFRKIRWLLAAVLGLEDGIGLVHRGEVLPEDVLDEGQAVGLLVGNALVHERLHSLPSQRLEGFHPTEPIDDAVRLTDRKSVVEGKRVDLGGRRIIKKVS